MTYLDSFNRNLQVLSDKVTWDNNCLAASKSKASLLTVELTPPLSLGNMLNQLKGSTKIKITWLNNPT